MADSVEVTIPYQPRELQLDFHNNRSRFAVIVCHRRFGKTVMLVNEGIKHAMTCDKERPRVAYIAPTYSQAKRIAWDYVKHFAGVIPGVKFNEAELRADFPNGGRLQLLGQDNPDSLRGSYFDLVLCDEYQMWSPRVFPEIIRPALADRKGHAVFTGTPSGTENPLHDAWQQAKDQGWFAKMHKASQTGYVDQDELDIARKGMSDEQYAQEFECSWEASIIGSIYGRLVTQAFDDKRIRPIQFEPTVPVDTCWDLGINDATAIWFVQRVGPEVRLVDYYEASGESLNHYVQVIKDRAEAGRYQIGTAILPHDVQARELGTGKSRLEVLQGLRLDCRVAPNLAIADGIEATKQLLKTVWIDESRCEYGIKCLMNYRREYNEARRTFYDRPLHDWSSHGCDALRYYAVSQDQGGSQWGEIEYSDAGII